METCSTSWDRFRPPLRAGSFKLRQISSVLSPFQVIRIEGGGIRQSGTPGGECGAGEFVAWWQFVHR